MMLTYCNGLWHINYNFSRDLALGRAQGAQEFLKAGATVLFRWDDHHERLISSCEALGNIMMAKLPPKDEIENTAKQLLRKHGGEQSLVKILATPGDSRDTKTALGLPTLSVDILPWPALSKHLLKLKTVHDKRAFPQFKLTSGYGVVGIHERNVQRQGYDQFLYWDERGGILEGPYANIFFVTPEGDLLTPGHGILHGVTRKIVLELARSSGKFRRVWDSARVHLHSLDAFNEGEVFLTSTTLGVHPVASIDGRAFNVPPKNPYTTLLQKLFFDYRERYYKERQAF